MKLSRILAIALALLLALPAMAGAESGSFTFRLSDPTLTMPGADEPVTQDFSGVGVQLGGVLAGDDGGLISLVLLAQGSPAASALLGIDAEQLYLLIDGLSNVLTVPLSELETLMAEVPQLTQNPQIMDIVGIEEHLSNLEFTQGDVETVEFYDTTGEYPRMTVHLSQEDFAALPIDVPENMTADISLFTDGGENVRLEGTLYNAIDEDDPDEANLNFVAVGKETSDSIVGAAWLGNSEIDMDINFDLAPSADYPDHAEYNFVLVAKELDDGEVDETYQIQAEGRPAPMEDGTIASTFAASAFLNDTAVFNANCLTLVTDKVEQFELNFLDASQRNNIQIKYDGTVTPTESGSLHSGLLSASTFTAGNTIAASVKIDLDLSSNIEGKLPDISGMPQLRADTLSDEEMAQLSSEAQTLMIAVAGKYMSVPSVAAIITAAMQGN